MSPSSLQCAIPCQGFYVEETQTPVYKRALDLGTAMEFAIAKKIRGIFNVNHFHFINYNHFEIKISFRNRGITAFSPCQSWVHGIRWIELLSLQSHVCSFLRLLCKICDFLIFQMLHFRFMGISDNGMPLETLIIVIALSCFSSYTKRRIGLFL